MHRPDAEAVSHPPFLKKAGAPQVLKTKKIGYWRRTGQATRGRIHLRYQVPRMAGQPGHGTKEGQIMEPLCRLQGHQQGLPKKALPITSNRSDS
jgi:hypothetical protein